METPGVCFVPRCEWEVVFQTTLVLYFKGENLIIPLALCTIEKVLQMKNIIRFPTTHNHYKCLPGNGTINGKAHGGSYLNAHLALVLVGFLSHKVTERPCVLRRAGQRV